ncbi:MAG: DUF1080 domain-containing protein [Opitutales bacterium]|nr:DUF1080 domain-containing protein [Opitutales bacterium]
MGFFSLLLSVLFLFLGKGLLQGKEVFFSGKDLAGWSAEDMTYWSVENGNIVGTKGDQKIISNQFLWYDKKVKDFKLTLQVKQVPFAANAGIQFRSKREASGHAIGYQADIGKGWWGSLYHEHGRRILAKNTDNSGQNLNPEKWNKYEILALGHRIWLSINGQITVALRDPIGELEGQISLQVHGGMPQKVIYKDLSLRRYPKPELLGMNEASLNKLLSLAPQGFIPSAKKLVR